MIALLSSTGRMGEEGVDRWLLDREVTNGWKDGGSCKGCIVAVSSRRKNCNLTKD